MSVDKACSDFTTGDHRNDNAYIEGGINWYYHQAKDLQDQIYLNFKDLPPPEDAAGHPEAYDWLTGGGLVNVEDYRQWTRGSTTSTTTAVRHLDAEDLIATFSSWCSISGVWRDDPVRCKGVDNDGSGFAHDISGWDFYDHLGNDPATYDSTYDHSDWQMLQGGGRGRQRLRRRRPVPGVHDHADQGRRPRHLDRTDDLAQAWLYKRATPAPRSSSASPPSSGYSRSTWTRRSSYCWKARRGDGRGEQRLRHPRPPGRHVPPVRHPRQRRGAQHVRR